MQRIVGGKDVDIGYCLCPSEEECKRDYWATAAHRSHSDTADRPVSLLQSCAVMSYHRVESD